MKNIMKCMIFGLFVVALTGCEDMNSVNQEYLDRGETTYIARIDSVESVVGLNKIWLKWWLTGDPRIAKTEVRWVEGIETKSREYVVDRAANDSLIIETVLDNMPEGSYTFELVNWDDKGNRSVSVTIAAEIVGDRYRSSFRNRQITIATKFGNGYALVWGASECIYSDFSYKTTGGETVTMRLPADADETPRMFLYDYDGNGVTQKTYYLRDTPIFHEIIETEDEVFDDFNDVSVTLTASQDAVAKPGNFDIGGDGVGFHDSNTGHDPGSGGANYRPNLGDFGSAAMDIEGDGGNIGYSNPGEWVQFTVDVQDEDYYEIDWNISVNNGNAACHVEVDGKVYKSYPLLNNSNWSNWRYYCERNGVIPPIHRFTRGKHTVRFQWETGGFNFNGLRFRKADPNERRIYLCPKTEWRWTIEVSDAHTEGGGKDKIIDGSYNTSEYWHSMYNPDAPLPHWAVIDMQKPVTVAKIVTLRRATGDLKTLAYYIGDSAEPDPDSPLWTKITEGAYASSSADHSLTLEVATPVAGRYLFLYIPDSFRPPFIGICEIDVYGVAE